MSECESAGIYDSGRIDPLAARIERGSVRDTRTDAELMNSLRVCNHGLIGPRCELCASLTELARRLQEARDENAERFAMCAYCEGKRRTAYTDLATRHAALVTQAETLVEVFGYGYAPEASKRLRDGAMSVLIRVIEAEHAIEKEAIR